MWDILSYDFKEKNPCKLKSNVLDNISDGSIIVFHNNLKSYTLLKETLKEIIIELKKLGYSFSSSWQKYKSDQDIPHQLHQYNNPCQ